MNWKIYYKIETYFYFNIKYYRFIKYRDKTYGKI